MIVLDTCTLLWWTLSPETLSAHASKACASIGSSGGLISSISVWEVGLKANRGELTLGIPLRDYVARLGKISGLAIVPVDERLWIESLELAWSHRDPADRVIVALAQQSRSGLVTKDRAIRDYYKKSIW